MEAFAFFLFYRGAVCKPAAALNQSHHPLTAILKRQGGASRCLWKLLRVFGVGGAHTTAPMWLLALQRPWVGTLYPPPPTYRTVTRTRVGHPCSPSPARHIKVLPGYQRLTICSVKTHHVPRWRLVGTQPNTVCLLHCRHHAKHWTVFNFQNNFSGMLFPRISLLGQIIQLSVCLLLIPKLGGGPTYHLFCRLVFSQNTTIKIALACN